MNSWGVVHRCLTREGIVVEGLATGKDAPLEVREGGIDVSTYCVRSMAE